MFISRAYALSYITWIIFYDRDAKELVIMQPQLNMERLLSLIFVRERLKRVLSSKKQFSCRAFCLENFKNYIVGSCGCQATAKSDGFLQKSIENTTIEKNFKYLRPQTLITLSSMALMRDCVRRANFTTKPRLKAKFFAFALFMRGYSFQLYCPGNSFMQNFATLYFENETWW